MICCLTNPNLRILQYFLNMNIDLNYQNSQGMDCLLAACMRNKNPQIIKYLVENKYMNLGKLTSSGENALTLACKKDNCIEVISYIALDPNIDVYYRSPNSNALNSLSLLCLLTNDLNKIKFFVEDLKMDLDESSTSTNTYLTHAMKNKVNPSLIVQYLLETTTLKYDLADINVRQLIKILSGMQNIQNLTRFNELLSKISGHDLAQSVGSNHSLDLNKSIDHLNPLTIDSANCNAMKRTDPFKIPYHQFTELADRFGAKIAWIKCNAINNEKQYIYSDFTSPPIKLFVHNQVIYYGDPKVVYQMIDLLDELKCID